MISFVGTGNVLSRVLYISDGKTTVVTEDTPQDVLLDMIAELSRLVRAHQKRNQTLEKELRKIRAEHE